MIEKFTLGAKCSEKIYHSRGNWFDETLCPKLAVIECDGKPYCKIHDPEYIKERHRKSQEKREVERKAQELKWQREDAVNLATAGLTLEELKAVTPAMIKALAKAAGK